MKQNTKYILKILFIITILLSIVFIVTYNLVKKSDIKDQIALSTWQNIRYTNNEIKQGKIIFFEEVFFDEIKKIINNEKQLEQLKKAYKDGKLTDTLREIFDELYKTLQSQEYKSKIKVIQKESCSSDYDFNTKFCSENFLKNIFFENMKVTIEFEILDIKEWIKLYYKHKFENLPSNIMDQIIYTIQNTSFSKDIKIEAIDGILSFDFSRLQNDILKNDTMIGAIVENIIRKWELLYEFDQKMKDIKISDIINNNNILSKYYIVSNIKSLVKESKHITMLDFELMFKNVLRVLEKEGYINTNTSIEDINDIKSFFKTVIKYSYSDKNLLFEVDKLVENFPYNNKMFKIILLEEIDINDIKEKIKEKTITKMREIERYVKKEKRSDFYNIVYYDILKDFINANEKLFAEYIFICTILDEDNFYFDLFNNLRIKYLLDVDF